MCPLVRAAFCGKAKGDRRKDSRRFWIPFDTTRIVQTITLTLQPPRRAGTFCETLEQKRDQNYYKWRPETPYRTKGGPARDALY